MRLRLFLPMLAALVIMGCGGDNEPAQDTAPAETTTATQRSDQITGWGATKAAWDGAHTADDRFDRGSAYDPDPSLARGGDDRFTARYFAVTANGGRVVMYQMRFAPGTSAPDARAEVLKSEFPADARATKLRVLDTCAVFTVRSRTLQKARQGSAAVVLSSGEAADTYDHADVWTAIVTFAPVSQC